MRNVEGERGEGVSGRLSGCVRVVIGGIVTII